MITGVHTMFYSSKPEELRAFLRDVVGFSCHDVGGGWLIFDIPKCDMGCHPLEGHGQRIPDGTPYISFFCDNLETTMTELKAKGVEFTMPVKTEPWGHTTQFQAPGNLRIDLYQPLYTS